MTPILISGPVIEPVSLADAKQWLRVDGTAEDELISALITSARLVVEAHTRLLFVTQTWRALYDNWPSGEAIQIPLAPLLSLDSVKVYDAAGVGSIIPAASYVLDYSPMGARMAFLTTPPAPGRKLAGIELQMILGFGPAAADVPPTLRQAIKMLAARWFENRGDALADSTNIPGEIAALIKPFRRVRLA